MGAPHYTLEQLAEAFGLTSRTARYYIETVLPGHHRMGPGRVAQYGQDTWNCFKFIRTAKAKKLTLEQIRDVLERLPQEQIDRVANGSEDLAIVSSSSVLTAWDELPAPSIGRAADRVGRYADEDRAPIVRAMRPSSREASFEDAKAFPRDREDVGEDSPPRWQVLYADEELQITHRGTASPEQREEVRLAAELIRRILYRR